MKILLLTTLFYISTLTCTNIANAAQAPIPDEEFVCVISTYTLNAFFEQKGYGKNFWRFNSSEGIKYNSHISKLVLQSDQHDKVYMISENGEISEFPMAKPGLYFFRENGSPSIVILGGDQDGLEIVGRATVPRDLDEFNVCVDVNNRYYARMFRKDVNVMDRFVVFDRETMKEQFSGSGYALYLESDADSVSVVTFATSGDGARIITYKKSDEWHLAKQIDIPAPSELRPYWHFSFSGFDSSRSLLIFHESIVAGSPFAKEKIWLYDLRTQKYILEEKIPKTRATSYVFILPERFADAPYMLWTKKLAK